MSSVPELSKISDAGKDALMGQCEARLRLTGRKVSQSLSTDGLIKPASGLQQLKGRCSVRKHMVHALYQGVRVEEVIPMLAAVKPGSALKAIVLDGALRQAAAAWPLMPLLAMNAQGLGFPD
ncbi:MAG: hypothetical protein WAW46_01170 [Polaromonas sp.]